MKSRKFSPQFWTHKRMYLVYLFIFIFASFSVPVFSQTIDSLDNHIDSLTTISLEDTVMTHSSVNSEKPQKEKKIRIVRRDFNYRTQIGAAFFMMGFIALIIFSVDNINPD